MLRQLVRAWVIGVAVAASPQVFAGLATYTFIDLGSWTGSPAINDSGRVVLGSPARLWTNGTDTPLPGVAGGLSTATSINSSGVVAGYSYLNPPGDHHATTWTNGTPADLGTLGGQNSYGLSINDAGQVVGYSSPALGDNTPKATLWSGGAVTPLASIGTSYSVAQDINNSGRIVGVSGNRAVYWNGTAVVDISGGLYSAANAVDDTGRIVGFSAAFGSLWHAVLWHGGGLEDLGTLGGAYSAALDINDAGEVVGTSADQSGRERAFLWSAGTLIDLNSVLDASLVSDGWQLTSAMGINASGAIVGQATHNGRAHAFLLTPVAAVPEPHAASLLLIALLVLGRFTRKARALRPAPNQWHVPSSPRAALTHANPAAIGR